MTRGEVGEEKVGLSLEGHIRRPWYSYELNRGNFHGHGFDLVTRYHDAHKGSGWKKKKTRRTRPSDAGSSRESEIDAHKKETGYRIKAIPDGSEACNFYPEANLLRGDIRIFGSNGIISANDAWPESRTFVSRKDVLIRVSREMESYRITLIPIIFTIFNNNIKSHGSNISNLITSHSPRFINLGASMKSRGFN